MFVFRNISIVLESEKGGAAELDVSYQVWGVSWVPTYDIRVSTAEDEKGTMKVRHFDDGHLIFFLFFRTPSFPIFPSNEDYVRRGKSFF